MADNGCSLAQLLKNLDNPWDTYKNTGVHRPAKSLQLVIRNIAEEISFQYIINQNGHGNLQLETIRYDIPQTAVPRFINPRDTVIDRSKDYEDLAKILEDFRKTSILGDPKPDVEFEDFLALLRSSKGREYIIANHFFLMDATDKKHFFAKFRTKIYQFIYKKEGKLMEYRTPKGFLKKSMAKDKKDYSKGIPTLAENMICIRNYFYHSASYYAESNNLLKHGRVVEDSRVENKFYKHYPNFWCTLFEVLEKLGTLKEHLRYQIVLKK